MSKNFLYQIRVLIQPKRKKMYMNTKHYKSEMEEISIFFLEDLCLTGTPEIMNPGGHLFY